MLYIKSISTNAKSPNGQAQSWELGAKTLIVGPNEAGKSAIAQSAQLIAEGGAAGLLCRKGLVKLPAHLMSMAPAGEALAVRAELSDGEIITWSAEPGKKPAVSKLDRIGTSVETVRAAFSGSAATTRKFLAEALPLPMVQRSELTTAVPELFHPKLDQLLGTSRTGTLSILDLYTLAEGAEEQRKAAKGIVDKATATGTALSPGIVAGSAGMVDGYFEQLRLSVLADFFKQTGPTAKHAYEAGDTGPLSAVRWLAAQIGGKEALSKALPLDQARRDFMGIAGNIYTEELAATVRARAAKAAQDFDAWGHFIGIVNDLADALLESRLIPAFEEKVNAFLPESDRFMLDRSGLFPGLMRNGRLQTALSGSTEARVLAAMTAALAQPDSLNLLVVDDRMWDGITLSRMLRALEDAPCQVIVMSTMLPRGRRRASWATIELDARYSVTEEE